MSRDRNVENHNKEVQIQEGIQIQEKIEKENERLISDYLGRKHPMYNELRKENIIFKAESKKDEQEILSSVLPGCMR